MNHVSWLTRNQVQSVIRWLGCMIYARVQSTLWSIITTQAELFQKYKLVWAMISDQNKGVANPRGQLNRTSG